MLFIAALFLFGIIVREVRFRLYVVCLSCTVKFLLGRDLCRSAAALSLFCRSSCLLVSLCRCLVAVHSSLVHCFVVVRLRFVCYSVIVCFTWLRFLCRAVFLRKKMHNYTFVMYKNTFFKYLCKIFYFNKYFIKISHNLMNKY